MKTDRLFVGCVLFALTTYHVLAKPTSTPGKLIEPGTLCDVSALRDSFDSLLAAAPPLDPNDQAFDEQDALAWHAAVGRLYLYLRDQISPEFFSRFAKIVQVANDSTGPVCEQMKEMRSLTVKSQAELFVKKFALHYMEDTFRLAVANAELEDFLESVGLPRAYKLSPGASHVLLTKRIRALAQAERNAYAKLMRNHEETIRNLIYKPALTPLDVSVRKTTWAALEVVASEFENIKKENNETESRECE